MIDTVEELNGTINYNTTGGAVTINDYEDLIHLPRINGIELKGNKTSEDLGIKGVEYEAGNGIDISGNKISVDNTIARASAIENLGVRISAQDNRIEEQNTNISNIDTELNTFKEDYLIDMGGIVEEINNRYTKTEVDNLIPDMSDYYNKTGVDNKLVNKASLSIDYGDDAITVTQDTNSFTLSPTTGGYELDISGSVVTTLASKNYVDSKLSPVEEQIVGWTNITPNTYHEVDIRNALANGKKRFTILIYMRKGESRQATKYELTITELEKLFTKATTNELIITRMIMGVDSTNRVAMLKQFLKQTYDENNQVILGLLQIKYQGYENNTVIGTFDNFQYTIYAE